VKLKQSTKQNTLDEPMAKVAMSTLAYCARRESEFCGPGNVGSIPAGHLSAAAERKTTMSCNLFPDWAKVTPHKSMKPHTNCPVCGYNNWQQFKDELQVKVGGDYYAVGHIPPEIILDCPECENDFSVKIFVMVYRN
jgi:hypothetical protein